MFFPAQTLYMKLFFYSALMVSSLVYFWNAKIWIDIIYYYTYILCIIQKIFWNFYEFFPQYSTSFEKGTAQKNGVKLL